MMSFLQTNIAIVTLTTSLAMYASCVADVNFHTTSNFHRLKHHVYYLLQHFKINAGMSIYLLFLHVNIGINVSLTIYMSLNP